MGDNLVYAVRGSTGVSLKRGLSGSASTLFEQSQTSRDVSCDVFQYSNSGRFFAYCDRKLTRVLEIATGKEVLSAELKKTKRILFSPKDTLVFTFEQYAIYGQKTSPDQKPDPNVRVFSLSDGKHLHTLIAHKESSWEPQWNEDESIAVRMVGGEIMFHSNNNFDKYDRKMVVPGATAFALSPATSPSYIAVYVPASGSNPAHVRVHRTDDNFTQLFIGINAEMPFLILASVEVDASNQSYYGEQSLYLINVQSDESVLVPLAKNGPVYSAKWNPNGKEFAVCYGYMPAKVTFYNMKGIPTFDTQEGPRNDLYYNAFGNILLICGFGNLSRGTMEFWDVEKKKQIVTIDVPNTTIFEWAPDGQHFLTATTAPRLRLDNCYRFWHYSGRMLHEVEFESPKELWEIRWRPMNAYNKFEVREMTKADQMAAGLPIKKRDASHPLNNVPAGAVKKQTAYVPPHLRKGNVGAIPSSNGGNSASAVKPQQSDNERKVMNLKKKIDDIQKLKERIKNGEELQVNQLDKVKKEQEFLDEIKKLQIS
ncbi:unnamed protein product [Caenorhabditis auriculariae]|uniref:Eukaryotic translation initiation factor 2A n=1 Tax=Caenorhabditis auriculariae TaxID=2777116 RepID=A0A8S1HKC3_9PELO|nr:unnamed protein product [Caenorhabditis auriculariae]